MIDAGFLGRLMDECLLCGREITSLEGIRLITIGFGVIDGDGMPTEDAGVMAMAHMPCVLSSLLDGEYHDDRSSLQARLLRVVEASELIQRLAKPPLGEVNGS